MRRRQPERRKGIGDGTIRTAKCIIHEGDEDGEYYIHYGVITFKWQRTSERRDCGQLLVKEWGGTWLRHIYTTDKTTLESIVIDIKKQFDSGISYNPTEDRRET